MHKGSQAVMAKSPRETFYILDAFSLIYQVFHALPPMSAPDGSPTNAVFGIFRDLLNLSRTKKPDYLAAAFDGPGRVFRSDLSEDYKARRPSMPDDLRPQIDVIRRLFEGFRIPVLIMEGVEADDIIATLAKRGAERDLDVFLCTADKDARQLLNDRVRVYNLRKNLIYDAESLKNDWGIRPAQVVDFLALTGDSVDNVRGVPGVGPKTAAKLLQEYGDLDTILANASAVPGGPSLRKNLEAHADVARLARSLVKLREDLPLELNWEALQADGYDPRALRELCLTCGFHRFLDEIVDEKIEIDWSYDAYETIDDNEKFQSFLALLREQKKFCLDTETTGLDPLRAKLVGLSFSWREGKGYYLPVRGPSGDRLLDESETLDALRPILTDPTIEKVGQNLKYDLLVLRSSGLEIAGPITDTMVLDYLLESGERNHSLNELSRRLLNHTMIGIEELIGKGKNQRSPAEIDARRMTEYAVEDADATWRLERILTPRLRREGLWDLYANLERPLIRVLADMEATGIAVDVPLLKRLSKEFARRLEAIEAEIHALAGRTFSLASPVQLRQVLFDQLKLPVLSKTPGGEPSTSVEVLEELATTHPLPRLMIQHRRLAKLKGTYLDALPALVHPEDGRIHASFNQVVTATGRLSSSDPNLQNIPVRSEEGRQIRQAFVPGEFGWKLLTADYSQIELRVLAHYSGDPALVQAFNEDRDIHSVVASEVFGVDEPSVTAEQRRIAKTVNFGVIYGLSPFGLAARLGISQAEAATFIDAYFARYSGVDSFIARTLEKARDDGRVETLLGRRRAISGIKNVSGRNRNEAERMAVNAVIQGSAADLIKRAMLLISERIEARNLRSRMLLQIHDELIFESPPTEISTLSEIVRDSMTSALPLNVPIKVDLAAGPNWLDVEE